MTKLNETQKENVRYEIYDYFQHKISNISELNIDSDTIQIKYDTILLFYSDFLILKNRLLMHDIKLITFILDSNSQSLTLYFKNLMLSQAYTN